MIRRCLRCRGMRNQKRRACRSEAPNCRFAAADERWAIRCGAIVEGGVSGLYPRDRRTARSRGELVLLPGDNRRDCRAALQKSGSKVARTCERTDTEEF